MIGKFLIDSFPCTKFLINYRSDFVRQAESQLASLVSYKKGQKDFDAAVESIEKEVQRLKKLAELLGNRAKLIDSAKWTEDIRELNKVVKWLGFDDTCAFPKLMELNTGRNATNTRKLGELPRNERMNRRDGKRKGPRGSVDHHQPKPPIWFVNKLKSKPPVLPKAYQHSETNVELDPRCRYVGHHSL
jgi:hypothetical protein